MQSYLTIQSECRHTIEISRSVFICSIKGVKDFDEALDYKNSIAKKYGDATHNCYAVRMLDDRQKFFDDGEPGGTAGQPMLQVLKNRELYNVVAVVTRYFGGIKLGAGGLVGAYSAAVAETINLAEIVRLTRSLKAVVRTDYNTLSDLNNFIRQSGYKALDTHYTDIAETVFICPEDERQNAEDGVAALSSGRAAIEWIDSDYYLY
ncbi:MAG: IMPACT family protein [Clostridia bacterium]|nr:IMPACT family protein [Clostridia bacterium]